MIFVRLSLHVLPYVVTQLNTVLSPSQQMALTPPLTAILLAPVTR